PDNVAENYRRLLAAVGCAGRTLTTVRQVHGAACAAAPVTPGVEADAIISADPGTVLSIRVADCVPILLADRRGRAVGAVHAGWRGVIAGVVPQAIAALQQRHDVKPDELVAAVGPCISVAHFEVG